MTDPDIAAVGWDDRFQSLFSDGSPTTSPQTSPIKTPKVSPVKPAAVVSPSKVRVHIVVFVAEPTPYDKQKQRDPKTMSD